ncbi:Phosphoinositide phospholipase C [Aphelenchoides besseyi]|nr:Phosphoinositide phospholipase C [Aphelenchoides besseyi]
MAKEYQFSWRSKLPDQLAQGEVFDRYDDETGILDMSCPVRFEEMGFYIVWEPKGREAGVLDLVAVWEARPCGTIKDLRVIYEIEQRGIKESIDERTIWITYGQDLVNVSSLFLVASSAQIAREWRQLINEYIRSYKFRHTSPMVTLQKHWRFLTLSTNERTKIPLRNIIRTFASGKSERMIHKCLTDLGLAGDKFLVTRRVMRSRLSRSVRALYTCGTARKHKKKEREELDVHLFTFEKFLRLYHKICPRTDVQELFVKLSGQKEYLTREKLINFLNEEQRDPRLNEILFPFFDNDRVQQLLAKHETDDGYVNQGKMSGDGFLRFLMSDDNSPVFLDRTEMYQDMDQPLCHYYINSSHNTYLTSRQYGGKSSTEIYRQVLLSGCRCIELDCWDGAVGESKDQPIITHGKALCSDVPFKEVLYQIRDTAFMRSDFPVILSFENHCSKSNQLKMARYCVEVFGDMLLGKPLDDFPLDAGVPLPSPNRLKRKILIKNKRLKPEVEKHQMEQFLREGKLDEEDEMGETPDVIGEDTASPHHDYCYMTDDDDIPSNSSPANRSAVATPQPHEISPLAAIQAYGRLTPSSSRSFASISGPSGLISSRQNSPRNSIDSRSLLLAAFGGDVRRLRGSQKSTVTSVDSSSGIERFDRSSSRSMGGSTRSPRFPFRSSVKSSTNSPPAGSRGSGSGPTPSTPTGDMKPLDEAHPEMKQTNFMSKLKPLGFSKKPQQQTGLSTLSPNNWEPQMCVDSGVQSTHLANKVGNLLSLGRNDKRSFRRPSNEPADHSITAALLDAVPVKRQGSHRSSKSKKPILTKEEEERIFAEYNYTGATTNIHPLLSALVNYTCPVKFSGFDVAESNNLHFHMSSFSESTGLGYLKQCAPEFVNYNKRQLSRIYPKGARVDSSNFLPQIFWNAGCQMVTQNFQTPDVCMQLNQGKFDYNGQCGYLLKPDFMRRPDRSFDPFSESPVDGVIAAHCSVRVISGQFLCERKVGTYVEVEMYGLPTDTIRKEHRTKTVAANGLNPVYNEDPFVFRKVVLPELAVLRFAVYDESGKQLGQRILPLDGLQSGYRHISLRTESNMPLTLSTLFVQLVLKTYVPDELSGLVDALADPRAYLSARDKRQEALHNMGVDDTDIVEVVPATGPNANGKTRAEPTKRPDLKNKLNGALHSSPSNELRVSSISSPNLANQVGLNQSQTKTTTEPDADNKYKSDPININDLRKDKAFQKLAKKLHKENEELRKRHQKARDSIQKLQQTTVDKMICDTQRISKKRQNSTTNSSRHSSISAKGSDPLQNTPLQNDQKMRSLVSNQTDEWSSLLKKQSIEEFEMRKAHIREEYDVLKKLLADVQKQQMAALRIKFEVETKELKQNQTKKSMDDSRALQQDKNIKTKAERDRRIKELNEKNVKVFVEERKRLGMKRRRHEEKLEQKHTEQIEALEKEVTKILELEEMNHQESVLAARLEAVV